MTFETPNDLASFHQYIATQLQAGVVEMTPEQALEQYREQSETIASVQRGLVDLDAERTRPAEKVLDDLKRNTPRK